MTDKINKNEYDCVVTTVAKHNRLIKELEEKTKIIEEHKKIIEAHTAQCVKFEKDIRHLDLNYIHRNNLDTIFDIKIQRTLSLFRFVLFFSIIVYIFAIMNSCHISDIEKRLEALEMVKNEKKN